MASASPQGLTECHPLNSTLEGAGGHGLAMPPLTVSGVLGPAACQLLVELGAVKVDAVSRTLRGDICGGTEKGDCGESVRKLRGDKGEIGWGGN